MNNLEQTLSIIKPDAVERNLNEKIKDIFTKNNLKIKKNIVSHLKISVPTYKKNKIPNELKLIPISTPGSRFIK